MTTPRAVEPRPPSGFEHRSESRYPEGRDPAWVRRRRALVAAQDEQARRFLSEALARAGYSADVVLRAPEPGDVDGHSLLILQSETSGLDVARGFRLQGGTIPILLIRGGPGETDDASIAALAPAERLSVPFTLPTLRAALARLVP